MANHFRKPEDGQDEVSTPSAEPVVASHFALSTDADAAQSQVMADAAPAAAPAPGDTGAFLASAGVASAAPAPAAVPDPFAAPAPAAPQMAELAAIPEVTAEPEVTADQADEVADLNAALADPNFTTVFAPVTESRQKKARDAGVEPVILFEHVTKVYPAQPNKPALDDVNIEIYPGEFVFLVGHSGSGKSTMLRTMTRDVKPTSGRVLVAGQDLMRIKNRKVPFFRRQIGTVFQDFKLLPGKTVYENVAFVLQCIGKPRGVIRTQVPEVLRLVGLADQMGLYARPALGRRAAARLGGARHGQPPAAAHLRRAYGQPRPGNFARHHEAPRAHQPHGHHGHRGDARPRDGRLHAPPCYFA